MLESLESAFYAWVPTFGDVFEVGDLILGLYPVIVYRLWYWR